MNNRRFDTDCYIRMWHKSRKRRRLAVTAVVVSDDDDDDLYVPTDTDDEE